jgi:hypothetical protein
MLHVFGDESHDARRRRVLSLAGLLAPREAWARFWISWGEVIELAGITTFHAADCENTRGEFARWTRTQVEGLQRTLIQLITDPAYGILGYSCSLDLGHYNRLRPRLRAFRRFPTVIAKLGISGSLEDPYFILFQHLVERVAKEQYVTELPADERVGFAFDRHHLEARAKTVYHAMQHFKPEYGHRLGGATFDDKVKVKPLQAADMLAYETFRRADDLRSGIKGERWQFTELVKIVREGHYFDAAYLDHLVEMNENKVAALVASGRASFPKQEKRSKAPPTFTLAQRSLHQVKRAWRRARKAIFGQKRP